MGKKGHKTRWRKLAIPIGIQGNKNGHKNTPQEHCNQQSVDDQTPEPDEQEIHPRITFNEDEYTKITTPRQDMLFKKGYLSKKKSPPTPPQQNPTQDNADSQSGDSAESEQYICDEQMQPQYVYPAPTGYIDHTTGLYFVNSNSYEVYDPYTGNVTLVVGGYPGGGPLLTAMPCQPLPIQPLDWFPQQPHHWNHHSRKKPSSTDSQNCSPESTCPPSSPQEGVEGCLEAQPGLVYPPQPYVYPGYMFQPPLYNVNGVSVGGVPPPNHQPLQPADTKQRRKKRRRRRRGGVTDEGSESSCEEAMAGVGGGSGASSDTGPVSLSSKTDSGVHTDPAAMHDSGSNSPALHNSDSADHMEEVNTVEEEEEGEEEEVAKGEGEEGVGEPVLEPPQEVQQIQVSECIEVIEEEAVEVIEECKEAAPEEIREAIAERIEKEEEEEVKVDEEEKEEKEEGQEEEGQEEEGQEEEVKEELFCEREEAERLEEEMREGGRGKCERCQAIERLAEKMIEETVEEAVAEVGRRRGIGIGGGGGGAITEAVARWLATQGAGALAPSSSCATSEDEGIDADAESSTSTGQKNGSGNPSFRAPSLRRGSGRRVATTTQHDWDCYPLQPRYLKGTPGLVGPFPCAVCCILQ